MMVYKKGNLFDEDVEAIVNAVNCVGVMGAGIALQFKRRFLDNFEAYAAACGRGELVLGKNFVYKTADQYIINFPTKDHWRDPSYMKDLDMGLIDLVKVIKEKGIKSIAIPALGCGLGGLEWSEVKARFDDAFSEFGDGLRVVIFEPN